MRGKNNAPLRGLWRHYVDRNRVRRKASSSDGQSIRNEAQSIDDLHDIDASAPPLRRIIEELNGPDLHNG